MAKKILVSYRIFQVSNENRNILFLNYDFLKKNGIEPTRDKYNEVYSGLTNNGKTTDVLENLYRKFNIAHPEDFKGHSLSVSDVVELDGRYFFCDRYGFKRINF